MESLFTTSLKCSFMRSTNIAHYEFIFLNINGMLRILETLP
jgi:hypothetical protein